MMAARPSLEKERLERLVVKYRAERAARSIPADADEIIDDVAERIFGSDEGYAVLVSYLQGGVDGLSAADGAVGDGRAGTSRADGG